MAAIEFPTSPANGTRVTSGDKIWQYDSTSGIWSIVGSTITGPVGATGPQILGATDPVLWDSSARQLSFSTTSALQALSLQSTYLQSASIQSTYIQGTFLQTAGLQAPSGFIGAVSGTTGSFTTSATAGALIANVGVTGSRNTGAISYGTLGYSDQNILASFQTSVNNYAEVVIQNSSSGVNASTDLVLSNNLGTASAGYIDLGINSSGWNGTSALSRANAGYLVSTSGDLVLGTTSAHTVRMLTYTDTNPTDALTIDSTGYINLLNDTEVDGMLFVGTPAPAANTNDAYTNPIAVLAGDYTDYTQVAIKNPNSSVNSSADIIVYPDNGNDSYGWMDMGVTSSAFADPTFTITGVNDGYLFSSAPKPVITVVSAVNTSGTVTVTTGVAHGFTNTNTATVTAATGNGTTVTYTSYNKFTIGQTVTVTGLTTTTGSSLNLSNQTITYADSAQFQISNTTVGTATGTQSGTASGLRVVRLELSDADITGAYYYVGISTVPTTTTFTFTLANVLSVPSTAASLSSNLANITGVWFPTGNGNLVLATDRGGFLNDILFGAAGLASNNFQMRISALTNTVTINSSLSLPNAPLAIASGGTGQSTLANAKAALSTPGNVVYNLIGALSVQTGTQKFVFPTAATIVDVTLGAGTAPTGSSATFDILKNGTTIFSGTKPSIAAGAVTGGPFTPTTTAVTAGQYITVNVSTVGSTLAGSDVTVIIRYSA